MRIHLVLLLLLCGPLLALGQQPVKGRIYEDKTRVGLVNIRVQNLNGKQTTVSDNNGKFTINAKLNDLLVFTGFAYQPDTMLVTNLSGIEVFLLPQQHMLKDVKVKSMDGPSMAMYDPYFHGQTTAYQTDKDGNFKGGVLFRFWYWKKDERKRQKRERMLADQHTLAEIDKAFSPEKVAQVAPLQGAELRNFVSLYRPTVAQYRSNAFSMADHINTSYQKFMKLSPERRQAVPDSVISDQ